MSTPDYERARSALAFISPDDRDTWVRMGMAIKDGLGDEGFDLWDAWSRQSDRYVERDARDVWKSIKRGGGITLATLFHEAKVNGWRDDGPRPTPEELEAGRKRAAKEKAEERAQHEAAAARAAQIWEAASTRADNHPYLIRKRVKAYGVRVHDGSLVVPVRNGDELHSLQYIAPDGIKKFLNGGPVSGCYFSIGDLNGAAAVCISEGFATGASIHEATGHPVVVAFNAGNLLPVAKAMREPFPELHLIVCADDDARTPGNPGLTKATAAARAVGGLLVAPDFGKNRPEAATDFNDLHQHAGLEAVARCIEAAAPGQSFGRGGNSEANQSDAPGPAVSAATPEPGLTDLGNAHRFARDHGANVRYCWPWGRWLVWNSRYWCRDETGEIHRLAETTIRLMYEEAALSSQERREALGKWAVKCESHERRVKMLASAQAISGIPIRPEDMDRDLWCLNVLNGTIDLRTGTLRSHAREDYITRCLDVDYDPTAECPTWERFIHEVFSGNAEIIAFVQRVVGYSLTGAITEHVLIVLYGLGSNGKTTLIDALHYLLGPSYAKHAPTDLLLARRGEHHPTELATLHGARLVTAVETGEGRRLAESLVKQLTGGDPVTARRMREDFWQFRPEFKLWLATNHKPQIRGTDHAIWRRIRLIPFDVTFHAPEDGKMPLQDSTLPERLREELAGVLRWAVEGCLAWQREGLKTPQAVRDATEGYRAEMDVFAAFLEERCIFDESAEVRASDLYRAYTSWCEGARERVESQRSFGRRLTEKGCERYRNNGIWYLGVRLRATNEATDGTTEQSGT